MNVLRRLGLSIATTRNAPDSRSGAQVGTTLGEHFLVDHWAYRYGSALRSDRLRCRRTDTRKRKERCPGAELGDSSPGPFPGLAHTPSGMWASRGRSAH